MQKILISLFAVMIVLTVVAYTMVLPEEHASSQIAESYFAVGDEPGHPEVASLMEGFREYAQERGLAEIESYEALLASRAQPGSGASLDGYLAAFSDYYTRETGKSLEETPRLVWSTDSNPAREVQMALFRAWHLRNFGEPVDITTDPSNRELTKAIVQSVAGAGPDVIEYIGAAELRSLATAGIALDVTEVAQERGFGVETVFEATRSGIALPDEDGELRQYGYPCNVGYTVLFFHRDMFERAGVSLPMGGWTIAEMRELGAEVLERTPQEVRPRFAVMNVGAFDIALAAGGHFFPPDGPATHSIYNSPESIAGLREYQDLMYEHGTMPRPAEAASMSTTTSGGFGADVAGSAPGLFAQRSIAMYVGGRWEYVTYAAANRDRVIVPAIDRELASLDPSSERHALLSATRRSLVRDVLVPLTDAQYEAMESVLDEDDRRRLLQIGAVHVPTVTGVPYYSVPARGAVVNRALERDDPERLEYALRFLQFLGSEAYNEQINGTYDSICGRIEYCVDEDGVSGPPRPLPGLEGFDAPVFTEAMLEYAHPWQLSPYIGRNRLGDLVNKVLEDVTADTIEPGEAAAVIEESLNRQILANLERDALLADRWASDTGFRHEEIEPGLRGPDGTVVSIREQIERLLSGSQRSQQ